MGLTQRAQEQSLFDIGEESEKANDKGSFIRGRMSVFSFVSCSPERLLRYSARCGRISAPRVRLAIPLWR